MLALIFVAVTSDWCAREFCKALALPLIDLPLLFSRIPHAAISEEWCSDPCTELNGNVQLECDSCKAELGHRCYPGANGYDSWRERLLNPEDRNRIVLGANGQQQPQVEADPDVPLERTSHSVVYASKYYDIAMKKRDSNGRVVGRTQDITDLTEYEQSPLPVPQPSPRFCEVHACELVEGDDACTPVRTAECTKPAGHLLPIGRQFASVRPAQLYNHAASGKAPLDAAGFWRGSLSRATPLMIKGGAARWTDLERWSDEALLAECALEDGEPWRVLVEKQNRITQNDRHPLMPDWDFCRFLREYRKPEYKNMLYLVTSIAQRGLRLAERLAVPEVLRCAELYHALYDARLWMSLGNTTSSMHFDTHENLLLQLSGEKEVLLWHPDESANFYLDHHEKFGLSPINVDRVDLERFPSVANATTYIANLSAGDAVYIPDGWWHVVRSHSRNVAIALEFAPYGGEADAWPTAVLERKGTPGVFWAEQTRIAARMREQHAERIPSRRTRRPIQCDAPIEGLPSSLAQVPHLGMEPAR